MKFMKILWSIKIINSIIVNSKWNHKNNYFQKYFFGSPKSVKINANHEPEKQLLKKEYSSAFTSFIEP